MVYTIYATNTVSATLTAAVVANAPKVQALLSGTAASAGATATAGTQYYPGVVVAAATLSDVTPTPAPTNTPPPQVMSCFYPHLILVRTHNPSSVWFCYTFMYNSTRGSYNTIQNH